MPELRDVTITIHAVTDLDLDELNSGLYVETRGPNRRGYLVGTEDDYDEEVATSDSGNTPGGYICEARAVEGSTADQVVILREILTWLEEQQDVDTDSDGTQRPNALMSMLTQFGDRISKAIGGQ